MPKLLPFEPSFFETAPLQAQKSWDVNMSAADLWTELVDRPLHWVKPLSVRWTTPKPFGVGTERIVTIAGALKVDEHFIVWDEGSRYAFFVKSMGLPAFKRFGESFSVEPTGKGTCRFTWHIVAEPTALSRPLGGLALAPLKAAWLDTTKHFNKLNAR